jgi:hypothetical protein
MVRCFGSVCGLTLCALLNALSSEAQLPKRATIDWDGPASCPRPQTLDADVARRLDPVAADTEPTDVDVRVRERADAGYDLTLTFERASGRGTRDVQLADCVEVHRAAALLISSALAPAESEPAVEVEREPPPRDHETRALSLRAGAVVDLFALPSSSVGPAFGMGFSADYFALWAEGRYLPAATSTRSPNASVDIDLFAGAAGGAFLWRRAGLSLGPAAELEIGGLRARSRGDRARSGAPWGPWYSVGLGALIDYEIGSRVGFTLAALAGLPLRLTEFLVDGELSHELPRVTARVQLSIRLLLGSKKKVSRGQ